MSGISRYPPDDAYVPLTLEQREDVQRLEDDAHGWPRSPQYIKTPVRFRTLDRPRRACDEGER